MKVPAITTFLRVVGWGVGVVLAFLARPVRKTGSREQRENRGCIFWPKGPRYKTWSCRRTFWWHLIWQRSPAIGAKSTGNKIKDEWTGLINMKRFNALKPTFLCVEVFSGERSSRGPGFDSLQPQGSSQHLWLKFQRIQCQTKNVPGSGHTQLNPSTREVEGHRSLS